jgi:hypothetical protein
MRQEQAPRPRKPLWLLQLYNWLYWHPSAPATCPTRVLDHALMSPGLRRYLPDDPLYVAPNPFEELHNAS